jgi:hypothetical protein
MKYTTKVAQPQNVGGVEINPRGGNVTEKELEKIKPDPWGKELISKGILQFAGVKPSDIKAGDPSKKPAAPKGSPSITTELNRVSAEEK